MRKTICHYSEKLVKCMMLSNSVLEHIDPGRSSQILLDIYERMLILSVF